MTDERRYQEDEVADIFEAAAAPVPSRRGAPRTEGLTLAELQEIGREVGIAPERIAAAASSLERGAPPAQRRTTLGMPIAVRRTLPLPRPLTDREWGMLVSDLRETFGATGKVGGDGDARYWRNGNLHAFVEPTETGYRLRLGTVKGNAIALNRMGAAGLAMALIVLAVLLLGGEPVADLPAALLLGAMGAGAFAFNALRLPRWADEREAQMESIVERTRALIEAGPDAASD
jgi:hypothetical protein